MNVAARLRMLPYPIVMALAGVAIGFVPGIHAPRMSPDLLLAVFVPGLVFEAALGLALTELWEQRLAVGLLATVGVALSVVLIGLLTHMLIGLALADGMLLGAILAATDPIAVVALLRQTKAPPGLTAIVEGESLLNDGTGVAAFSAVLATIVSGTPSVADASLSFLVLTAGGTFVGLTVGGAGMLLLRVARRPILEIVATLVIAYGSYLVAAALHVSGIVAVVVAGIVVARYWVRRDPARAPGPPRFWRLLAFVLTAILFVLVGAAVPAISLLPVAGMVLVVFAVMLVTRAIPVYGLLSLAALRPPPIPWRWRHLTFWSGLRGALAVALALSVAATPGVDSRVALVAYGVVLLSLIIQGGLLAPVTRALKVEAMA